MRRLVQSSIRRIDDRPGDTAFHYDCPLERGGFEPSVSRETFAKENLREYWRNYGSRSVSRFQRMSSLSVRHDTCH